MFNKTLHLSLGFCFFTQSENECIYKKDINGIVFLCISVDKWKHKLIHLYQSCLCVCMYVSYVSSEKKYFCKSLTFIQTFKNILPPVQIGWIFQSLLSAEKEQNRF